jgi:hypothetical protein
MRRSVGKQRGTRRTPRIRGGPRRFLAAFFTGLLLVFSLGTATAAAAASHPPARVPTHGGGYDSGQGSRDAQVFAREFRAGIEVLLNRLRHSASAESTPPPAMTPTVAPTPTTTAPTPPMTRPVPVPSTTPRVVGGSPGPAVAPSGANAVTTATVVPGASATVTAAGRDARGSAAPRGVGSGAGAPVSGPPPQATFPFPGPGGHGGVIRALRTAGSYGLLFALVGAVLVFLAVQGRVDRRDPRIARAPVDAHLDFRDLE